MPLPTGKARFWMIFFSVFAFLGPFFAILGIEGNKKISTLRNEKDTYTKNLDETLAAREQYQASVKARKEDWQQKMTAAKNAYDSTKATQTDAIANNQKTVTVSQPETVTYTPPPVTQTTPGSTTKPKTKAS